MEDTKKQLESLKKVIENLEKTLKSCIDCPAITDEEYQKLQIYTDELIDKKIDLEIEIENYFMEDF